MGPTWGYGHERERVGGVVGKGRKKKEREERKEKEKIIRIIIIIYKIIQTNN